MRLRLILASLSLFALTLLSAAPAFADTLVVNSNADDAQCSLSHCTLRGAIAAANSDSDRDTILFNLPEVFRFVCTGATPDTCQGHMIVDPIQPASPLPAIIRPLTIDGTSQPKYSGSPRVELRGPGASSSTTLLQLAPGSDGSQVRGLALTSAAVALDLVSSNNVVTANFVGLNTAAAARGNFIGIFVRSDANLVGGHTAADRNVVSANGNVGIEICACGGALGHANSNTVSGNLIGTDASGTTAAANGEGVLIAGPSADANVIGGGSSEGNVISGNQLVGLELRSTRDDHIGGNIIGLNAAATAAVPNRGPGVLMTDTKFTIVGQIMAQGQCTITLPGGGQTTVNCPTVISGGNVIAANSGSGVRIVTSSNVRFISLLGNRIGTNFAGANGLGNGLDGIDVVGGTFAPAIDIGGPGFGEGNRIAFNGLFGVHVANGTAGVVIRFNSIGSNGNLGLAVEALANSRITPPVLTSVSTTAGSTTVQGQLLGRAGQRVDVDFYASAACDSSGVGEGERFLGSTAVTPTSDTQAFTFSTTLAVVVPAGQVITATTTEATGGTSGFSGCVTV
jgi:hypothetical protein